MALSLKDRTSNANNLTNSGVAESSLVPFLGTNNSHSLDLEAGSSQYAYIADANQTGLDIAGDFTIECWVKLETLPSGLARDVGLVSKYDVNANRSYLVQFTSTDLLRVTYSSDGGSANRTIVDSNAAFVVSGDVGSWVHIAVSVNAAGKTAVMYKNASSVANTVTGNAAASVYNGTGNFAIGGFFNSGVVANPYDGLIDDVRVWSDIRTATEILDNMAIELVGNEANLVGYWKLNNGYLDETSNNNDLTSSGSPVFSTDMAFASTNTTSADFELTEGDYLYIADASQTGLDLSTDFTFETWVRLEQLPSTIGADVGVIGKYDAGANKRSFLWHFTNTDLMRVVYSSDGTSGNRTIIDTNAAIVVAADVGHWVHLAVAVDISAQTAYFYKNSSLVASTATATAASTIYNNDIAFSVGSFFSNGSAVSPFDGVLDEVRVWSDIRTATEISNNFTRELVGNEANLVGYWTFDEISSISATPSASPSSTPSVSPSLSPSASPSIGYTGYSRGNYASLPTDDADLETTYSAQDVTDVGSSNDVRVGQAATSEYMIHQYKNFVGTNSTCQLNWEGQSTQAPTSSTVYLQIYNRNSTTWETVDSDNSTGANTDFVLTANIADLTNYKDASNVISCRIYQLAA